MTLIHGNPLRITCPFFWGEGGIESLANSPHKWSLMWSFDVSIVVSFNNLLNKQSSCRSFETFSGSYNLSKLCMKFLVNISKDLKLNQNCTSITKDIVQTTKAIHWNTWLDGYYANFTMFLLDYCLDSKVHEANMGPTWVLWAPDGPHVGPMSFAIRIRKILDGRDCIDYTYLIFAKWHHKICSQLVQIMAGRLFGTKPSHHQSTLILIE